MAEEVNFNLGIDFGTSYTKVCIQGDDDLETSDVINFGGEDPNKGMLSDGVYCYGTDHLVSTTEPNDNNLKGSCYRGIKVLLKRKAQEEIEKKEKNDNKKIAALKSPLEEIENICAYYLANVIATAKKTFENTKEGKKRLKGKSPKWTANIGVPVEYYDSPILAYFHRVLHLALKLEQKNLEQLDEIPYSELEEHLREIRSVYKEQFEMEKHLEEFSKKEELKQHFDKLLDRNDKYNTVLPELESIVRPFREKPKGITEGIYFFFDIGGGTVDGTACYLRPSDRELVPVFYHSTVKENGVDTLDCSRELVFQEKLFNEIKEVEKNLPKALIHKDPEIKGDYRTNPSRKEPPELELPELPYPASRGSKAAIEERVKSKQNKEDETILKIMLVKLQLQQQLGEVIMKTKKRNPDLFPKEQPKPEERLKLIIFGGGSASPFYKKTLPETYSTFKQYRAWIPEYGQKLNKDGEIEKEDEEKYKIELLFNFSALNMNGLSNKYFNRYVIAYGLSYPRGSKSTRGSSASDSRGLSRSYYDPKEENRIEYDRDWRETSNIGIGRLSS